MTDYLLRDSCYDCEDVRMEASTGAHYCKLTPGGCFECKTIIALRQCSDTANRWAQDLAEGQSPEPEAKRALAEAVAEGLSDYCWSLGATFDSGAFLSDCGFGDASGQLAVLVTP